MSDQKEHGRARSHRASEVADHIRMNVTGNAAVAAARSAACLFEAGGKELLEESVQQALREGAEEAGRFTAPFSQPFAHLRRSLIATAGRGFPLRAAISAARLRSRPACRNPPKRPTAPGVGRGAASWWGCSVATKRLCPSCRCSL